MGADEQAVRVSRRIETTDAARTNDVRRAGFIDGQVRWMEREKAEGAVSETTGTHTKDGAAVGSATPP
jgi:hypothetical protein